LVSRVGASGGGKAYGKTRPAAYYSVLSIIVVLGLSSVVYSRYERQHPVIVSKTFPAKGTVGYFALAEETCGTVDKPLTVNAVPTGGFSILTKNVIELAPTTDAEAGTNATVGAFIASTPGLALTSHELVLPTEATGAKKPTTFTAGEACPAGTKYAGKKAYPEVAYWTTLSQRKPSISNDPSAVVLSQNMLVTLAFEPKGVTPSLPSNATIEEMYAQSPTTTTTTTFPITNTTQPTTTTTSTTTTVPVTTTTKG
jgi:hypothetical protein